MVRRVLAPVYILALYPGSMVTTPEVMHCIESTLDKSPGWLTTSVLPGEDGMCVVYGHRNRNHLKVLEKVERGDTITVKMGGMA